MKNKIRKARFKNIDKSSDSHLLYNFSFIVVLSEILVGCIIGISIFLGYIFSFIVFKGDIFASLCIFIIILIISLFFILLFKYFILSIILKKKEVYMLEGFLNEVKYKF